jgi:aspartyl/asparaginyl beta-hydroxylase (cupin superfamily)
MFWLTAAERDALWGGVRAFCPSTPSWRIGAMLDLLIADHDAAPVGIPRQYATTLRMPGLRSAGWFDAADFAWMPAVTHAFSAICDDLDRIADEPERFQSYVGEDAQGQADALAAGWRSYFFCRDGRWHDGAARRCPAVLALIDAVPWFPGDLMFSALAPGTEIPFHYGLDNLHLTLHLPLLVPDGCGLMVDGIERTPIEGRPLIFDDTFRHAAWNRGASRRTHLLIDVWHPGLDDSERAALRYLVPAIRRHNRARPA